MHSAARSNQSGLFRVRIPAFVDCPGNKTACCLFCLGEGKGMPGSMLVVDVFHAIPGHEFVCRPCETDAAPVVSARRRMSAPVFASRIAIAASVLDVHRSSVKCPEIGLPPCSSAHPHARETVRQYLSEMVRAIATHGMSTKEDAVWIDVEFLLGCGDCRINEPRNSIPVPTRTIRRRRRGRSRNNERSGGKFGHEQVLGRIEILCRRSIGRRRTAAMQKHQKRGRFRPVHPVRNIIVYAPGFASRSWRRLYQFSCITGKRNEKQRRRRQCAQLLNLDQCIHSANYTTSDIHPPPRSLIGAPASAGKSKNIQKGYCGRKLIVLQFAPFKRNKAMNIRFEFTRFYYFGFRSRSGFACA